MTPQNNKQTHKNTVYNKPTYTEQKETKKKTKTTKKHTTR